MENQQTTNRQTNNRRSDRPLKATFRDLIQARFNGADQARTVRIATGQAKAKAAAVIAIQKRK